MEHASGHHACQHALWSRTRCARSIQRQRTIGGLQRTTRKSSWTLAVQAAKRHLSAILSEHGLAVMGMTNAQALKAPKYVPVGMNAYGRALRCVPCTQDGCRPDAPALRRGRYSRLAEGHQNPPTLTSPGGFPFARMIVLPVSHMCGIVTACRMPSGCDHPCRRPTVRSRRVLYSVPEYRIRYRTLLGLYEYIPGSTW